MTGSSTASELSFTVPGVPIPQGSKRLGRHGTRFVVLDDNDAKLRPWRRAVALVARQAARRTDTCPWDGPVLLALTFVMPRPKTAAKRLLPHVKPDLSKLIRAVEDSLTEGGVWTDDSRVVAISATKRYACELIPVGVHVEVTRINEARKQ